jgi:hypothetical protein
MQNSSKADQPNGKAETIEENPFVHNAELRGG